MGERHSKSMVDFTIVVGVSFWSRCWGWVFS